MTRPVPEIDVEQARERATDLARSLELRAARERSTTGGWSSHGETLLREAACIRTLLSSHERLTREVERLRDALRVIEEFVREEHARAIREPKP